MCSCGLRHPGAGCPAMRKRIVWGLADRDAPVRGKRRLQAAVACLVEFATLPQAVGELTLAQQRLFCHALPTRRRASSPYRGIAATKWACEITFLTSQWCCLPFTTTPEERDA